MFVVSLTYTWACLYTSLHKVVMKMSLFLSQTWGTWPLTLSLVGSSVMRLEDLTTTYVCHSCICGSESFNPYFTPSWSVRTEYTKNEQCFILHCASLAESHLLGLVEELPTGHRKCHKESMDCPRCPMAWCELVHCWGCVCKAQLGSQSCSHMCRAGFYGGKNKAQNFTVKLCSFAQ